VHNAQVNGPSILTYQRETLPSARQPRVACFDLLDTVLFRSVIDPSDVFRIIGLRLKESLPEVMALIGEDTFVSARRVAELHARRGKPEITLEDIWNELTWMVGDHRDKAMEIELSCEREVLFPNAEICDDIAERRARGQQIAFISDMYLPEAFLRSVLEDHGIMQRQDRLFVSSTVGKTKSKGELYHHVIADIGGKPSDYRMIGDHRHSDHRMPRSLGLSSKRYVGHKLNRYERRLNNGLKTSQLARSILVGSIRRGRSDHCFKSDRLVADFLGPASMLWAIWAIRRAEESNVDRLFFLARDAYLPYLCAKQIVESGHTPVKVSYLYGSRYSLYFATMHNIREDVQWIFTQAGNLTKGKLLRYLQLDSARLSPSMDALCSEYDEVKVLKKEDFDRFVAVLKKSKDGAAVLESAAHMRTAAREYYKVQGLTGPGNTAVVDIGWHLNIQAALQRLLPEKQMHGLYLYLSESRRRPSEAGRSEVMMELSVTSPRISASPALWSHATVAEHLLGMAPEGTCTGFQRNAKGEVQPVLQEIAEEEAADKRSIAEKVQHFADKWLPFYMLAFPNAETCASAFRVLSDEYLANPTRESILAIPKSIYLSKETLNDETSALADGFQMSDVTKVLSIIRRRHQGDGLGWLGAKFSLAPAPFNLAGEIVRKIRPYLG